MSTKAHEENPICAFVIMTGIWPLCSQSCRVAESLPQTVKKLPGPRRHDGHEDARWKFDWIESDLLREFFVALCFRGHGRLVAVCSRSCRRGGVARANGQEPAGTTKARWSRRRAMEIRLDRI